MRPSSVDSFKRSINETPKYKQLNFRIKQPANTLHAVTICSVASTANRADEIGRNQLFDQAQMKCMYQQDRIFGKHNHKLYKCRFIPHRKLLHSQTQLSRSANQSNVILFSSERKTH